MRSTSAVTPFNALLALNVAGLLYFLPSILDGSKTALLERQQDATALQVIQDEPAVSSDSLAEESALSGNMKRRAPKAFGRHGQTHLVAFQPHPLAGHPNFGQGHASSTELVKHDPSKPHPTATCEVCVHSPDDPLCVYGLDNVRLSRSYLGSGHRVRKVIEKALRGEAIRVGIIGGSVSTGHGLDGRDSWHKRWFKSFREDFPGADHQLYDGSVPAMDSAFFSYCYTALIPDDLDLYFVELDINNVHEGRTFGEDDALLRGILGLPHAPAVIRASVVATSFPDLALGHTSTHIMATYFDIPVISIRNFLLPHFIAHPETSEPFFSRLLDGNPDYRHISYIGHDALADQLTLYFKEQTCEARRRAAYPVAQPKGMWPQADVLGLVPRLYLWEPFSVHKVAPPVHAQCEFSGSERKPLTPVADPTLTDSEKWTTEKWNGKSALTASEVGTKISFEFEGTRIGLFRYVQNAERNPPEQPKPGRLGCWLDGKKEGEDPVVLDSWHADATSRSEWTMVKDRLPYGKHVLNCEILEESSTTGHEVRILGVASQ